MAERTTGKAVTLVTAAEYHIGGMHFVKGEQQLVSNAKLLKRLEAINENVGSQVFKIADPERKPPKKAAK